MGRIMGSRLPFSEDVSFAECIKVLEDYELVEMWEETLQLETALQAEWDTDMEFSRDYERLILQELQCRLGRNRSLEAIEGLEAYLVGIPEKGQMLPREPGTELLEKKDRGK